MNPVYSIVLLIFALVLPACSGTATQALPPDAPARQPTGAAEIGPASSTTTPTDVPPVEPLEIRVTLDENGAVEALIPLEGGSLSLEAPDGARFTLFIPDGALIASTWVRMTPVVQLEGLPFGALTYAVDLQPEGLAFYQYATLLIETPQPIPLQEQIFFGYQQDGKDVFLAPPEMQSQELKILLSHFSGYGVAKGILADLEPVRQRLGGSDESRIQSEMAEAIQRERQRQILGVGENDLSPNLEAAYDRLSQEYVDKVIRPRVAAAGESCSAARLAIETVSSFERQLAMLGTAETVAHSLTGIDLNRLYEMGARACMQEEYDLCAEQHVVDRIIPMWISILRLEQILGISTPEAPSQLAEETVALVEKCLTFELMFESNGMLLTDIARYEGSVSAVVPLRFHAAEMKIRGAGTLVDEYSNAQLEGCQISYSPEDGTFETYSLILESDLGERKAAIQPGQPTTQQPAWGTVTGIAMHYRPGVTKGQFTATCEGVHISEIGTIWFGTYLFTHEHEQDVSTGKITYHANDWTIHGGELFAEREWQYNRSELQTTEQGSMKLYHRPGQ